MLFSNVLSFRVGLQFAQITQPRVPGDEDTIVLNGDLGALNITGVDKEITITGGENYSFDVLNILNSQGITLKDLTFKKVSTAGNGDTNPAALYVQNSSNIAVENCIFDGSDIGSDISGTPCAITTAAGVTNFSVENSTIRNFTMSSYHNPGPAGNPCEYHMLPPAVRALLNSRFLLQTSPTSDPPVVPETVDIPYHPSFFPDPSVCHTKIFGYRANRYCVYLFSLISIEIQLPSIV